MALIPVTCCRIPSVSPTKKIKRSPGLISSLRATFSLFLVLAILVAIAVASSSALSLLWSLLRIVFASSTLPFKNNQRGLLGTKNNSIKYSTAGSSSIPSIQRQTLSSDKELVPEVFNSLR